MSAPAFSFYNWVKKVPGEVFHLDEIPLLGFPPPFPWENLALTLCKNLQIEKLNFQPGNWQWRQPQELFEGIGDKLKVLHLAVSPLDGFLAFVLSEKDLQKLFSLVLAKDKVFLKGVDEEFLNSFYRFLAIEAINVIEKLDFDKQLSFSILNEQKTLSEPSLTQDITINLQDEPLHARLLLSNQFRGAWKQRYLSRQANFALTSPMAESLQAIVHLEGGKVNLSREEWKSIKTGDVLILDSCSLDVGEDKGRIMLSINGVPFFRAKVKQGSIKILEHPLQHEVETPMIKGKEEEHDDDESEIEEDSDLDFDDLDEDEDLESEVEEGSEEEEDFSDFDIDDDDEHSETKEAKAETAPKKPAAPAPAAPAAPAAKAKAEKAEISKTTTPKSLPVASIEEISMPVVIEVGRLQMSVKQLMEMQPGNMLELNIHPENGVDLVVNGTKIAKGELLRVGEVLGVRILELS